MTAAIIVQARMTSTRLPGKVLKPVLGKPLLEYQLERLRRSRCGDLLVVATTENDSDDPVVALCRRLGVSFFRGSEEDVLDRYHGAAAYYAADTVVRVTADCPLIDPVVIDGTIDFYLEHRTEYDYVSNGLIDTYPRGMDCEVFSRQVLEEAWRQAIERPEREHVTAFFYRRPDRYRLANVAYGIDASRHRWTVDTPEDFELISRIITALYPVKPLFTLEDCLQLVAANPGWEAINRDIRQKQYGE